MEKIKTELNENDFVTRFCSKCKHGSNIRYEYQNIGLADCEVQFIDRTVCGTDDPNQECLNFKKRG